MKNDLLCIASSCLDLIFTGMKRLPAPGTEEFSEDFVIKGGGGANTPVAASRLGLRTAFITQLGKDLMGEIMLRFFRDSGMNTEAVIQSRKKGHLSPQSCPWATSGVLRALTKMTCRMSTLGFWKTI